MHQWQSTVHIATLAVVPLALNAAHIHLVTAPIGILTDVTYYLTYLCHIFIFYIAKVQLFCDIYKQKQNFFVNKPLTLTLFNTHYTKTNQQRSIILSVILLSVRL
jgi:hypothetical protein